MKTEELVIDKLRALPPDRQQEVIDFIEFLDEKRRRKRPYPSLHGLCADLGVDIAEEDIAEARREMWGNFPREREDSPRDERADPPPEGPQRKVTLPKCEDAPKGGSPKDSGERA
ncbi:MAG TPA: DUF2281 domain-containing protein [Planctomycetota bacterium]|nr:DUF2281 domain-containing protein [Planctomycetota bacterium]